MKDKKKKNSNKKKLSDFVKPYRIESGKGFRLKDFDPADTHGLGEQFKSQAAELTRQGIEKLSDLQDKLYAQDRWALLLIFQAMDAAGKDSTVKHVMSGVNPQGCQVFSFKAPSAEELDHDFLWRTTRALPERGRIGIFNRSYYEEVLVVRVHKELLKFERIPDELMRKRIWEERYEDINCLEEHLARNGTVVRKFFLHVSKEEQKRRFLARLEHPEKNWKFSAADVREREFWDDYQDAYEDMIRNTATEHAPWFVVPADHKWFTRMVVAGAVVDALKEINVEYPTLDVQKRKELEEAKAKLLAEK
jgi:PPK2 family polyphosphate:nucleotide phosphotransferase